MAHADDDPNGSTDLDLPPQTRIPWPKSPKAKVGLSGPALLCQRVSWTKSSLAKRLAGSWIPIC